MPSNQVPADSELFDGHLGAFTAWQASPWGRLRYTVVQALLARHLPSGPLRVLDVGGGNGRDAVELARRGHHVTIVDIGEQSLVQAREAAIQAKVTEQISTRVGNILTLNSEIDCNSMDLVLCHNVVQYLNEPLPVILAALKAPLCGGGLLSLMAPNSHADPLLAAVRRMDLDEALELLDSGTRYSNAYDTNARACIPEEFAAELAHAGLTVVTRYGIRIVCDYIVDDARKSDPAFYSKLERLELAVADRPPYPDVARFFQFIAQLDTTC